MTGVEDASNGFCTVCLTPTTAHITRCRKCGSQQFRRHKEIFDLAIAHLDCDAFYAAVEKRDNPELVDKPVIIGGGVRGVVSTACYIARTYGVHSAMPMFKARDACPDAVIIKPDMNKYVALGSQIRERMRALTPLVEPISIDEAFMDMTGTERLHGAPPASVLANLQAEIARDFGVTVSIGLSHNKFLAKIASDFDKPSGFFVIGREETKDFLAQLPVTKIWGVGKVTARRLESDGIKTIAHLQKMDPTVLAKRYGEIGLRLAHLAHGNDIRSVKPSRATKSLSSETTFNEDIADYRTLENKLWDLSEKVSARMKEKNFLGRTITLKLKTNNFKSITRSASINEPSNLARVAFNTAKPLLREAADGRPFRLIGIGFSNLEPAGEFRDGALFDGEDEKIAATESAIDKIRDKFGKDAINAGRKLQR